MSPFSIARILVIAGITLVVLGGLVYLVARFGVPLGRLPGDMLIKRENFTFSFPLATSILVSIVLTIVLNLIARYWNR